MQLINWVRRKDIYANIWEMQKRELSFSAELMSFHMLPDKIL